MCIRDRKLSTSDFGTHFQSHSAVGFDSHIKPTSAAVDLGTSTSNWRHIYASGTIHVGSKSFGEVGNAIDTGTDNFATTDLTVRGNLNVQGSTVTVDTALVQLQNGFVFEGSTPDDYETTMTATNPTQDNTITIPNQSGNIVLTESPGAVQTNTIANSAVTNDKIADTSIRAAKLNLGSDTVSVNTLSATNVNATDFTGNITGVVQTAAQPNITSLGTLTALNVDNLTFDGNTLQNLQYEGKTGKSRKIGKVVAERLIESDDIATLVTGLDEDQLQIGSLSASTSGIDITIIERKASAKNFRSIFKVSLMSN